MEIILKDHNKESFKNIIEMFKSVDRVAIEQATATGKSYVIAKTIEKLNVDRVLFLAPSKYILNQFKNEFESKGECFNNIDYFTYSKTLFTKDDFIIDKDYKLIILDEYHRLGARSWGAAVNKILDLSKTAKVLGTTATPIRYLDKQRNMTQELFNGNVANTLTFVDAIEDKILEKPKYIIGISDISGELKNLKDRMQNLGEDDFEEIQEVKKQLKYVTSNFEKMFGASNVLKKYITDERKFIVFCEDIASLESLTKVVPKWFKEAFGQDVNVYKMFTGSGENELNYKAFENTSNQKFHLLFVVDILNEGVHIDGIDGLIMLRKTNSPNIFYQQLGRGLFLKGNKTPIIFDFVMNNQYIKELASLGGDIDYSKEYIKKKKDYKSKDYNIEELFEVYDESIDIVHILENINETLKSWNLMFNKLVEFKEEHGNFDVPKSDKKLYKWVCRQRVFKNKGLIREDRYKRLNEIGFDWDVIDSRWMEKYNQLLEFKKEFGHCNVPRSYEDKALATWVHTQRRRRDLMSSERKKLLKEIGFKFQVREEKENKLWDLKYKELLKFKKEFGHCNVSSRDQEHKKLSNWVKTQRVAEKKGVLLEDRKKKLIAIGFKFTKSK